MTVDLKFRRLTTWCPRPSSTRFPELKKLLELRAALTALKGPLGNVKAFRKKIQSLLGDEANRAQAHRRSWASEEGHK